MSICVSVAKTLFKMSGLKKYLKQETQWYMLRLEHPKPSDFYLSAWQTTRSVVPLLIWRTLLFLTSISIVISSMTYYIINGKIGYWFIYLTHWGLTVNTLTTAFSVFISARSYFVGPISAEFKLPWYIKVYWVLYNIGVPLAFLITIFYWSLLYEAGIEEELNHSLDVAIHGINSLVMFLLTASAAQPCRLLHFYQPLQFSVIYVIFGVIYYLAGGVEQEGNPWIYPVVNWANPGPTIGVVAITGLLLLLLHLLIVVMSRARDAIAGKFVKIQLGTQAEVVPLRQPGPSRT
ncbi:protein rolling stone isoform X2 [Manduca sexta]|uniref:protein rolling stone isoform X2 n=1 Tax=Manduca sexta TaxID=7130 RepID=UPI00188E230A|nr:protein rolling stone isoform X2 [Manduca sexta]